MSVVLGVTVGSAGPPRVGLSGVVDPVLERFLDKAWADHLARQPVDTEPGLYPVTVHLEYEVVGAQVVGMWVQPIEGARCPSVDEALSAALRATGRLRSQPLTFNDGVRVVRTSLLLEVPHADRSWMAADPETTAAFMSAVRPILGSIAASCHVSSTDPPLKLMVSRRGAQWAVRVLPHPATARLGAAFLQELQRVGMLAEGDGGGGWFDHPRRASASAAELTGGQVNRPWRRSEWRTVCSTGSVVITRV